MNYPGTYSPALVALSVAVAILASYTALDLAGRLHTLRGAARAFWLAAAATAAGGAIWSMHFIGMLAFRMPMPVSYDLGITLASLALPIAVTAIGLLIVARAIPVWRHLAAGGLVMGLGIVSMHYLGMSGMQMEAVIRYDPSLVAASVAIAVAAATAALWLASKRRTLVQKAASAGVMGLAISGMHYTGMAAATFVMAPGVPTPEAPVLAPSLLAVSIAATTLFILFLALVASQIEQRMLSLEAERKTERRLEDIARNFPGVIYRRELCPDGRVAYPYLSGTISALLGNPPADATPAAGLDHVWRLLGTEERERWEALVSESASSLSPFVFEGRVTLPDGSGRWIRSQASTHRRHDGAVIWDGVVMDVTEAKEAEAKIRETLTEKEVLLAEVHHRVRNNLQVIVGLMQLEASGLKDAEARRRIERVTERIGALGRIHDQLYRFGHFGRIDFGRYLEDLCASLSDLHRQSASIDVDVTAEPLYCDLETAVPLGLIANELVTNSFKHGFPGGEGRIRVAVRRQESSVLLEVADNGIGFDGMTDSGLGRRLIHALSRQLRGELRESHEAGTCIILALAGERFSDGSHDPLPVTGDRLAS